MNASIFGHFQISVSVPLMFNTKCLAFFKLIEATLVTHLKANNPLISNFLVCTQTNTR